MAYDERIMKCNIQDKSLKISLDGYDLAYSTYMEIENGNESIIFYTVKNTKYSIKHSQFRIEENMRELLNSGKTVYKQYSLIDLDNLKYPKSVKVYYTNESFKNITNSKLEEIISKSNLMCQSD